MRVLVSHFVGTPGGSGAAAISECSSGAGGALKAPKNVMPDPAALQAFGSDPAWAGRPFWMLNVLMLKNAAKYQEYARYMEAELLPKANARPVFDGYARTVIGRKAYQRVIIVEYPSPEDFLKMAMSPAYAKGHGARRQGLAEQYLIPMRPGWFHLGRPAPAASRPIQRFTAPAAAATPSGLVGSAVDGAREGVTSASCAQAEAFVLDDLLGPGKVVWHLNLLRFAGEAGKQSYQGYAKAMGGRSGVLSQFGARSTLATACYKSLLGDADFDEAIFAEYPSRDAFLSMGASDEYLRTAHLRHRGLEETYIISCLPQYVDEQPVAMQ